MKGLCPQSWLKLTLEDCHQTETPSINTWPVDLTFTTKIHRPAYITPILNFIMDSREVYYSMEVMDA